MLTPEIMLPNCKCDTVLVFFLNWSIIALQCCVGFCHSMWISCKYTYIPSLGFPGGSDSEESTCSAGDLGLFSRLEKSPREGNGNPLQYSCLENPTYRGAWSMGSQRVRHYWMTQHFSLFIASLLSLPLTPTPHPTRLGQHRAPSWAPCAVEQC